MAESRGKCMENKAFASYQRLMEMQTKRQPLLLQLLRHFHSITSKHNATEHVDAAVPEQQTQSSPVTDVKEVLQSILATAMQLHEKNSLVRLTVAVVVEGTVLMIIIAVKYCSSCSTSSRFRKCICNSICNSSRCPVVVV